MSDNDDKNIDRRRKLALLRISGAVATSVAILLGVYFLLEAVRPESGLISFSFLLVLPAAICAFATYIGDPLAERSRSFYMTMPLWLLGGVMLISIPVLREGVICVVMLAPLWIASGMVGAYASYRLRDRAGDRGTYCITVLMIPLLAMQIEPFIPLQQPEATVSRSIVINANPDEIWPLLRGIPDVRQDEGAWTFTQNVLGVPRPIGAYLLGSGIGAIRMANWGRNVRFREHIIDWQPGRAIGWRFDFRGLDAWQFTDRHLMPDSRYFKVTTGGYRMEPVGQGRTRVTLDTSYRMQTPVNSYSRMWGEVFLGDIETNLLTLIRQRAERG
ncbi:SRPBCC family protein [Sphingobium amiense]|uniref:SRPBCC family protein n=1 Tax=Sphingobium amiense TaxID=135719 RepID=A0A494WBQ1_9SPHN|nr:SRPBCC family protein [Sphingobium amiense]BBD97972.1 SRPBCC family protein [Sphingobium amiense]